MHDEVFTCLVNVNYCSMRDRIRTFQFSELPFLADFFLIRIVISSVIRKLDFS